jgi:NAD(P)-dependent dehydrogenase (short-subunit alcohol dehydrogenase family)
MSEQPSAPFSLEGQTALITGGGTGLGWSMAKCFVQAGAHVVLVGRREEVLQKAVLELKNEACYRVHDITQFEQNAILIDEIEATIGPIDTLINNAGNYLKKPALETNEVEFQSVLDAHLVAGFSLSRLVARGMVARQRGSILFVASMASFMGVPSILAYTAAKTAYLGMVRGLAAELSPRGVRINAIAPGWISTPMTDRALANDVERKAKIIARTPMGHFGDPEDIGHAAVYLSSQAAKFVTGSVLTVDGGASIGF